MKIRFKGNVKGPGEITLAFEPGEEREITLSEPGPSGPDKVLVDRDVVEHALDMVRCSPNYDHSSRCLQRALEQCLSKRENDER